MIDPINFASNFQLGLVAQVLNQCIHSPTARHILNGSRLQTIALTCTSLRPGSQFPNPVLVPEINGAVDSQVRKNRRCVVDSVFWPQASLTLARCRNGPEFSLRQDESPQLQSATER